MGFQDCIRSALDQGAVSQDEADALLKRFDELRAGRSDLGGVREQMIKELSAEAIERRRLAGLDAKVKSEIGANLKNYRDARGRADVLEAALGHLEHYGFHGYSSVEGRFKAIVGMAHAQLEEHLARYRRTLGTGRRLNKLELKDVVRSLFGETVQQPEAQAFARTWSDLAETMRQRFNAAGGSIPKLETWGLPQWHDARALVSAGREEWKAFITPLLAPEKMRHPLTGESMTAGQVAGALDAVYDRIVTDGALDRAPSSQRGGASLARQRQDHRFLVFKDADSWMNYAESFGQGDPFAVMMNHVRGMAKDISALEVLGPNPSGTVEWLIQTVEQERAKAIAGQDSLWRGDGARKAFAAGNLARWRIESVWTQMNGAGPVSSKMAAGFAAARNLISSAVLGSAVVTAVPTDPFMQNAARRLAGLPTVNWLSDVMHTFTRYAPHEAVRAGLILDDALHLMGSEARYVGALGGPEWSHWLPDRVLTWSGLTPWTQARKHLFGMEIQAHFADLVEKGTAWEAIDPATKRLLEGYGIRSSEWSSMAKAALYRPDDKAGGFLRPAELAAVDGRLAERYLEMIHQETERAVPAGTKRTRAMLMGNLKPGTLIGELVGGALQFKAFGLSFTLNQIEAIAQEVGTFGKARGARYAGGMMIGLTLGGALALQLKNLVNGKDPQDMRDPKFWLHAVQTGGGFGLFGDYLFADVNRFGQSIQETIVGPTLGAANDALGLTVGQLQKLATGEETDFAKQAVQKGSRYVPASSLWYLRAAWQRIVADQLQYLADPDAAKKFRQREQRLQKETGQEYWWRPGKVIPDRAPGLVP